VGDRRITQVGIETLTDATGDRRISQLGIEVLIKPGMDVWYDDRTAFPRSTIEIMWDSTTGWVDETDHLFLDGGIEVRRSLVNPLTGLGRMGQAPLGTATIRVRNDDSRFSKSVSGSQANTYGLHNKKIRISLGYSDETGTDEELHVVFTGRIVDINDAESSQTVTLRCHDLGEDLVRQTINTSLNTDVQTNAWIETVAAAAGLTSSDYNTEYGMFLVPYAYMDDDNPWREIQEAAASEGGAVFIGQDGVLRYYNFAHWLGQSSRYTWDESYYAEMHPEYLYDDKANVVVVDYQPRAESQDATVFSLRQPIPVPVNGSVTRTLRFRFPLASFGSYDLVAVTAGGEDISSDISLDSATPTNAQSWGVQFTNANTRHEAWITKFDVIGRALEGRPTETYQADPDSKAGTVEERKLEIRGNWYIQLHEQAKVVAEMNAQRLKTEPLVMHLVGLPGNPKIELGDKITVQGANTTIDTVAIVIGIRHRFGPAYQMDIDAVDYSNFFAYDDSAYFKIGASQTSSGRLIW